MSKKYSLETKLAAVQYYLNGSDSIRVTANKFNISKTMLHRWVKRFELHGAKGLEEGSYTNYSVKFKMDVLNYINETGASVEEAAVVYNISGSLVYNWKYLYEANGEYALKIKTKGRPPTMKKQPKKSQPVEGSEEALRAENERLRMENAYLKKLAALIQEKEKLQNKTKRK